MSSLSRLLLSHLSKKSVYCTHRPLLTCTLSDDGKHLCYGTEGAKEIHCRMRNYQKTPRMMKNHHQQT